MSLIERILCWLGRHSPEDGIDPRTCTAWWCARCGDVLPGALAFRRKR